MIAFTDFKERLPKLKTLPLGGIDAQREMMPAMRRDELRDLNHKNLKPKMAAVCALFYDRGGETHLALIRRMKSRGVHSGQIAFPGGRQEALDKGDYRKTALRETEEEIGIAQNSVSIFREGSTMYIPPSNFMVYPFYAFAKADNPTFTAQPTEVKEVLEIPLSSFLDKSAITETKLSTSYAKNVLVPAYLLCGEIVWGATAMMLAETRRLLLDAGLGG